MLVINPNECIDCGVCIPECPEEAIYQTDDVHDPWYKHNEYFSIEANWPNITNRKDPMPEYEQFSLQSDKTKLFSKNPGGED
jgi:ferredoxin